MNSGADLPLSLAQKVDQVCTRFEAACKTGAPLLIEDYLAELADIEKREVLRELILLDIFYRRQRRESCQPEDYRTRFPELAGDWLASVLSVPAVPLGAETIGASSGDTTSTRVRYFGDYELLHEIARGGMGVVYKARQVSLNRTVALKMILAGQLASHNDVQRFHQEAEAAANLDHPHIVPIYEIGEYESQHFFSMKLIDGPSLANSLAGRHKIGADSEQQRHAAALLATVARAVHHAHQRGLLHRDLKPGNILLDAKQQPHVTDFGLAKKVEGDSGLTHTGAIIGTPSYMAPEQARGEKILTTAIDVFGLGAVLYELLTGYVPFKGDNPLETLRLLQEREPVRPRTLQRTLDRDLETICLKCLAKDATRRYGSAEALAEDLERWLAGEPIQARRIGGAERAAKWVRRRPLVAGLLGAVVLVTIVGIGAFAWAFNDAVKEKNNTAAALAQTDAARQRAEANRLKAEEAGRKFRAERDMGRRNLYAAKMRLAQAAWDAAQVNRVLAILEEQRPQNDEDDLRGFEYGYLAALCQADLRTLRGFRGPVHGVAYSPDGRLLAAGGGPKNTGEVKVWDTTTWREILSLQGHTAAVQSVVFSPDGRRLSSTGDDHTVRIWDVDSGQTLLTFEGDIGPIRSLAVSPDGKRLAGGSRDWHRSDAVAVWDAATGTVVQTLSGYTRGVQQVVFSPGNADLLATVGQDGVWLWNLPAGRKRPSLPSFPDRQPWRADSVAIDPQGQRLAVGGGNGIVKVWDLAIDKELFVLKRHTSKINAIGFSSDGRRLATASHDHTVRVCNMQTGEEVLDLKGHLGWVNGVAFSPDGKHLASASQDSTVKVWDANISQERRTINGNQNALFSVAFRPDGQVLATGGEDYTIKVRDARSGRSSLTLSGHSANVVGLAYNQDGTRLVSASLDRTLRVWDGKTGGLLLTLTGHCDGIRGVAFSPDGTRLASGSGEMYKPDKPGELKIWDAHSGRELRTISQPSGLLRVAFSPDNIHVAGILRNGEVRLWDAATGNMIWLARHRTEGSAIAFSPNGRLLATGSDDRTMKLWDAGTGREVQSFQHASGVRSVAFSPDGKRLVSGCYDNPVMVTLWDVDSGQETLSLKGPRYCVWGVAFSPDGRRLAAVSQDHTLTLWESIPLAQTFDVPVGPGAN